MSAFAAQVVPGSSDWLARRNGCYVAGDRSTRLSSDNSQPIDAVSDSSPTAGYQLDYKYPALISVKQDPDMMNDVYRSDRVQTADMTSGVLSRSKRVLMDEYRLRRDWPASNGYHDNAGSDCITQEASEKVKYMPTRRLPTMEEMIQLQSDVMPSRGNDPNIRRRFAVEEPVDLSQIEQDGISAGSVPLWNSHRVTMETQYVEKEAYKKLCYYRAEEQRHVIHRHEAQQVLLGPSQVSPAGATVPTSMRVVPDQDDADERRQHRQLMYTEQVHGFRSSNQHNVQRAFGMEDAKLNHNMLHIKSKFDAEYRRSPSEICQSVVGDATAQSMDLNGERRQTWPLDTQVLPSWRRRHQQMEIDGGSPRSLPDTLGDGRETGTNGEPMISKGDRVQATGEGRSPMCDLMQLYDAAVASRGGNQPVGNDGRSAAATGRTFEENDDDVTSPGRMNNSDLIDEDSLTSANKKYTCHICPYVGEEKRSFDAHMKIHFDHWCPSCNYSSRTEGRLRCHIKMFHSKPEVPTAADGSNKKRQKSKISCRHCDFTTKIKEDLWLHMRQHIQPEKMLECPRCTFVTDLKHHLEYHLRSSHIGSKPYKCDKCTYRCFNQSMLNSHAKSHTNVYQFRCRDCTFAAKYCHALKVHIRRYGHEAAPVLNEDGSQPTDGSGDFALISRRGRPRGPRGSRDMPRFKSVRSRQNQLTSGLPMTASSRSVSDFEDSSLPAPVSQPNVDGFPEMDQAYYSSATQRAATTRMEDDSISGVLPSFSKFAANVASGLSQMFSPERGHVTRAVPAAASFLEMSGDAVSHYAHASHGMRDLEAGVHIDTRCRQNIPDELETYSGGYVAQGSRSSVVVQPSAPPAVVNYPAAGVPSPVLELEPEPAQCGDLPLDLTLAAKPKSAERRSASFSVSHVVKERDHEIMLDTDDASPDNYDQLFRRRRDYRNWKLQSLRQEESVVASDHVIRHSSSVSPRCSDWDERTVSSRCAAAEAVSDKSSPFGFGGGVDERLEETRQITSPLEPKSTKSSAGGPSVCGEDDDSGRQSRLSPVGSPSRDASMDGASRSIGSPSWVASGRYQCAHCEIDFHGSRTLHAMHMAYHSNDDPFQCNVCGERTNDRVSFFLHLARVAHN